MNTENMNMTVKEITLRGKHQSELRKNTKEIATNTSGYQGCEGIERNDLSPSSLAPPKSDRASVYTLTPLRLEAPVFDAGALSKLAAREPGAVNSLCRGTTSCATRSGPPLGRRRAGTSRGGGGAASCPELARDVKERIVSASMDPTFSKCDVGNGGTDD